MRNLWMAVVLASSLVSSVSFAQITAEDDWETPIALTAEDDWETPVALTAEDDWETPNAFTGQGRGAAPFIVFSTDDWESPVAIAPGLGGARKLQSGACLRAASMQWQPLAAREALPVQGFVNVCGTERWLSAELMDAAWMDSYVCVKGGKAASRAHVYQDAAGWHGLLYNFRLGRWEEKAFAPR